VGGGGAVLGAAVGAGLTEIIAGEERLSSR
jgi:hypothetical protein